jgi:hypothetical protein
MPFFFRTHTRKDPRSSFFLPCKRHAKESLLLPAGSISAEHHLFLTVPWGSPVKLVSPNLVVNTAPVSTTERGIFCLSSTLRRRSSNTPRKSSFNAEKNPSRGPAFSEKKALSNAVSSKQTRSLIYSIFCEQQLPCKTCLPWTLSSWPCTP